MAGVDGAQVRAVVVDAQRVGDAAAAAAGGS
jgi:hypothetical protein